MKKLIWLIMYFSLTIVPAQATNVSDFNLAAPNGKRLQLSKLLENGPVLLDFWATWCKPCIQGMPKLDEIHQKYKDRGLTVVGVNEDGPRGQTRIRPFLRGRNISFKIAIDSDGGVMKQMQVRALPTTILIAPDGEIVLRQAGLSDPKPLIEAIEMLLPKKEAGDENK
ncbi:MAG: thiol-disulfide isomerase/thioredoxin [Candidatus Latescibacterota bacterium]|jgi:thiol-disulfide isomerase/thioredoxin